MSRNEIASCATWGGIARVRRRNDQHPQYHIIPFRCGRAECEICRNIKRKRIMRRIKAADWPKRIVMWTITTDPKILTAAQALKTMNHRWHLLCRNLLREYPGIKFFRVMEFTESGLPHLHIIFNHRVEWRVLQGLVTQQDFGKVLHFLELPQGQAFAYVTKYMTKGLAAYQLARDNHIRMWSASMKFLPRVYYFDGQTEFSIVWTGRLNEKLDSVLDLCNVYDTGKRAPPLTSYDFTKPFSFPDEPNRDASDACGRPAR